MLGLLYGLDNNPAAPIATPRPHRRFNIELMPGCAALILVPASADGLRTALGEAQLSVAALVRVDGDGRWPPDGGGAPCRAETRCGRIVV
jgi:hypothetical protein